MSSICEQFNGDFNVGRGQLGFSEFDTLAVNPTELWVDAFTERPHRYFINPTGVNDTIRLPVIGTDIFTEAAVGHTLYIKNIDTTNTLIVDDSSGANVTSLPPGEYVVLTARAAPDTWEFSIQFSSDILTTKGDILTHDGSSSVRLPVGVDGFILTADSTTSEGIAWKAAGAGTTGNIAYMLQPIQITANKTSYEPVAYFPWLDIRYSGYTSGVVIFRAVISTRDLDIRLQDVTNGTTLGSSIGIAASGWYTFGVTNPVSDAQVELQVRKSGPGGANPDVFGVVLEFVQ